MTRRNASSFSTASATLPNAHRAFAVACSFALVAVATSCGSSTTAPDPLANVPDFIYVSNVSGSAELYTWHKGTSTLFRATMPGDVQPQTAAGKVVFTSYRVSAVNPEIFIAGLSDSTAVRLTTQSGTDNQPSLSPDGTKVVFTSTRSGTSRIWTMGADGSNQTAFNTGSTTDVPESAARYSPTGDRILFSSPRTNTTQIWVIPAAGGAATQVTHDVNGAFYGSWSPDGNSIYYVDGIDRTRIHNVVIATGVVSDYVTGGTDVGDAACTSAICLVVINATGLNREIYAYQGAGDASPLQLLTGSAADFDPAIIHR